MAAACAAFVAGCGEGAKPAAQSEAAPNPLSLSRPPTVRPFPARRLVLRDFRGRRVDIAKYRGKVVLVTFLYVHCPDICPLIVGNLRTVQAKLGPQARKLQIVAVSADPRGDTPKSVTRFLRAHQILGRMDYLIGSRRELEPVWRRWGILSRADPSDPEEVEHSAMIYAIGASGKVYTLYPGNFKPDWIVHDVPVLAAH
jgi:protein SCO1